MINSSKENDILALALHLKGFCFSEKYQRKIALNSLSFVEFSKILLANDYNQYFDMAVESFYDLTSQNINFLPFFNEFYPENLRHIKNAPFGLFACGNLSLLNNKNNFISIVGTRNPSALSIHYTKFISDYLSSQNITIVSGMASGIDSACHRAALEKQGGTIGVIAHGFNHIYPQKNHDLFFKAKTSESNYNILLLSEYAIDVKPKNFHFPRRNRIISGISKNLIFIEGGVKSGAVITVKYALDQGREIYVFDHPYLKNNEGGQLLINEGAYKLDDYFKIEVFSDSQHRVNSANYLGNSLWCRIHEPSYFPFSLS
ncbi:MAG: DNA-processing protein DprA [Spirochaetia bacterium]|nr:DNA-processing protein DprA [Spirochaetia bacterium]